MKIRILGSASRALVEGKYETLNEVQQAEVGPGEFTLKLTSEPSPVRGDKRVAVRVVDVYGNESVVVRDLSP
jgi:hypothetical protein